MFAMMCRTPDLPGSSRSQFQVSKIRGQLPRSRNYSPEREEFRRVHEHHRKWGLARRHARKLCRLHGCSAECAAVGLHDGAEVPPLIWPAGVTRERPPSGPTGCHDVAAEREQPPDPGDVRTDSAGQARSASRPETTTPTESAEPAELAEAVGQVDSVGRVESAECAEVVGRCESVGLAETAECAEAVGRVDSVGLAETAEPRDCAERAGPAEYTGAGGPVAVVGSQRQLRVIRDIGPDATSATSAGVGTLSRARTPHPQHGVRSCRRAGRTHNRGPRNPRPPPVARRSWCRVFEVNCRSARPASLAWPAHLSIRARQMISGTRH